MQEVTTDEEWRAICLRAIDQAKEGNAAAREWLSRHLIPDPRSMEQKGTDLAGLILAAIEEDSAGKNWGSQPPVILDQLPEPPGLEENDEDSEPHQGPPPRLP